jgi:hypothetical protein
MKLTVMFAVGHWGLSQQSTEVRCLISWHKNVWSRDLRPKNIWAKDCDKPFVCAGLSIGQKAGRRDIQHNDTQHNNTQNLH